MAGKRSKRRPTVHSIKPYYPIPPADRESPELTRLIGFSIVRFQRAGWRWLVRHGFLLKDDLGNLKGVPKADRPTKNRTKGDALSDIVDNLTSTSFMYGPERLAGRRWHGALVTARGPLEEFLKYASARLTEESDFDAHTTGGGHRDVVALTAEIKSTVDSLLAMMTKAQSQIRVYRDDLLPGLEGGRRPPLGFLAHLEGRLSVAGFTNEEIADLLWDKGRVEDQRSHFGAARTNHMERIRKRAAKVVPAIRLAQQKGAITAARFDEFFRRTGLRGKSLIRNFKVWDNSPEARALRRDERRLDAEAKRGK